MGKTNSHLLSHPIHHALMTRHFRSVKLQLLLSVKWQHKNDSGFHGATRIADIISQFVYVLYLQFLSIKVHIEGD